VVEVARNLLHLSHGLDGLLSFDVADLQKVRGIGKTKAIILRAAIELANRVKPKALNVGQRMQSSTAVVAYFQAKFAGLEKEQFHVVLLSPTKIVIDIEMISEGSLTETVVHPREVFRPAIVKRAHTIILIHNHPSGEARPSAADHALTRQLVQAGQTVGIRVIDHIIVGGENFYSMAEHNEIL
jgi:DNA repair protein RadC